MVLWFWATSFITVWLVFHDPSIDYRLLLLGSILPDIIDAPFVGAAVAHSLAFCVAVLVGVMVATIGRRALRRRLLFLPIGMFLHLVFDGIFANAEVFWWPFSGTTVGAEPLPSIDRGALSLVFDLVGLAALVWAWRRFGLTDRRRRQLFWRTGHLDPALV